MLHEYEKEILLETNQNACLTILANGLNYLKPISSLLELYTNNECLVFILNMSMYEQDYLSRHHKSLFCNVSKLTATQRSDKYKNGGVFFGTPTVIATDFINGNVEIRKISTIIVFNSETVDENSTISFICYLFKENNSLGLIKAFSSDIIGINEKGLGKMTNTLCLNKVLFYPRFHELVKESLDEMDVNQVNIKQNRYLEEAAILIEDIVKKIYLNRMKESGTFDFMRIIIHKQSNRDIIEFKKLILLLYSADSLSVFLFFRSMVELQKRNETECPWILAESTHILLDLLKEMLQKDIDKSFKDPTKFIFDLEKNSFRIDLQSKDCKRMKIEKDTQSDIDDETLSSIEDSDQTGIFQNDLDMLDRILQSTVLSDFYLTNPKFKKIFEMITAETSSKTLILVQNRTIRRFFKNALISVFPNTLINVITHGEIRNTDISEYARLILLSPDISSIRSIEYEFTKKPKPEILILQYKNSCEEQKFLEEIREEKSAFENMIRERSNLPLKLELDKIYVDNGIDENKYKITVDSREMRSKLPFFLYKADNKLEIKALELGDYIVGMNKVVERKSIDDFLGSLNSGRLYSQMQRLVHAYNLPILLIEFPDKKPVLSDFDVIENFRNSYIARFCLFLFNFPNIVVLWSDSNINSVKMLRDIQKKDFVDEELISEYDPELIESLLCIPGINSFNVARICKEFENICDLADANIERLEKVLDRISAIKIYEFFRVNFK